jgi:hypothetical protein
MKNIVYIGVDDTDILNGTFGTGRVAKEMAAHAESLGLGRTIGIIRHQLLVDPRIHYTSHNSSKCVEFESATTLRELHQTCANYLTEHFLPGSDPGVCTCPREKVTPELIAFGESAQKEVLTKEQAISMARRHGILLSEIGGTGEGIIGALASVGLLGSGNGGRYIKLRGIKEIKGMVTVQYILENTGITDVIDEQGLLVAGAELIDTQDRIRPNVIGGKPVLRLRLKKSEGDDRIWETVEQKHKKKEKEAAI